MKQNFLFSQIPNDGESFLLFSVLFAIISIISFLILLLVNIFSKSKKLYKAFWISSLGVMITFLLSLIAHFIIWKRSISEMEDRDIIAYKFFGVTFILMIIIFLVKRKQKLT